MRARIAVLVLAALFLAAAFAPLLANERPLAVQKNGTWTFPAFTALEDADLFWFGGAIAALAIVLLRKKLRLAGLVLALGLVVWGAAFHRERADIDTMGQKDGIRAPVAFGPRNQDFAHQFAAIGTPGHPLGTDELGRDVFARLIHGLRLSLLVGFAATAVALVLGVLLGAWAGGGGYFSDAVASWIIQASFCLPAVFVVAAARSLGEISLSVVVLVLALLRFGVVARLTRQECLRVRNQGFVLAARGLGVHPVRVFFRHVLPNALGPALVAAAFGVAGAILAEAGLSFLGLGVSEPMASLGRMLNDGRRAGSRGPHLVFLPGLLILVVVLASHAIAAAVRDALDPRGAEATS